MQSFDDGFFFLKKKYCLAVCVNVGSVHNPPTLKGLAHFLEHMLFLGTEKYPDENTYNRVLAEHGGHR